jgi:hypothetical protein
MDDTSALKAAMSDRGGIVSNLPQGYKDMIEVHHEMRQQLQMKNK